jgi:hypothetical protein
MDTLVRGVALLGREKQTPNTRYDLVAVLDALRENLVRAESQARTYAATNQVAGLRLEEARVDLDVTVTEGRDGGGSIGFQVIGISVGGNLSRSRSRIGVHRISLTLKPGGPGEEGGILAGKEPA